MGFEPVRQVAGDGARHLRMGQACGRREPRASRCFGRRQRAPGETGRRRSSPRCRRRSICRSAAARRSRGCAQSGAISSLRGARDPPVEHGAVAQHGIDMADDLRPVLGADIAAAAEIIGGDVVGRRPPSIAAGCRSRRRSRSGGHVTVVIARAAARASDAAHPARLLRCARDDERSHLLPVVRRLAR